MRYHLVCSIGLALSTAGCGTPQVALDQANNTVTLIQNLQTELTNYKQNTQRSSDRRLKSTQQSDIGTFALAREHQWGTYLYRESGLTGELAARARLRDASDAYAKVIADQDKARDDLAARLASITKELPSPNAKLGAVQKAMAELGTELSASERVTIVSKFLKQAKCIVDQSAKPSNSAASAPAPAAAAASAASAPSTTAGCTTEQEEKV